MQGTQSAHRFEWSGDTLEHMSYLLYIPQDYTVSAPKRMPLVLFLHGAGERGDDLERVASTGLPNFIQQGQDYPFIVVSPQCPLGESWVKHLDLLKALLDEIINTYSIDTERIYLTGLSMGGFGTWALAIANPHLFAAIAPICGGGNPDAVCAINHVPVWTFHGALDTIVPLERTTSMVEALKCCNGNVQFTIYPDAHHDSWTQTYSNPALYSWLLQQTRIPQ